MKSLGKATVICTAFNHEDWIWDALESVAMQDYHDKELIIVDNGSSDGTVRRIKDWLSQYSGLFPVKTYFFDETRPYCKTFNEVFAETDGDYLLDLSGDDVLYPDHLSLSIAQLSQDPMAAFSFSDAYLYDSSGSIRTFYKRNAFGELKEKLHIGTIYETLLRRSIVCAATMVFNAKIFRKESGYDESLYYEDFDIQIRMARKYHVLFSDHIGVLKREHEDSMSARQYQRYFSKMLPSTVKVCEKALELNHSQEENKALLERVLFELKHALWSANFSDADQLIQMAERLNGNTLKLKFYKIWARLKVDLSWLYVSLTG